MTHLTVQKLNQLNQMFYQQIATEFDQTREKPWSGWSKLLPFLTPLFVDNNLISFIDLGCGNGRFGEWLFSQFSQGQIQYMGYDNSQELLSLAQKKLGLQPQAKLANLDIVEALHTKKFPNFDQTTAKVVTLFGVMHHLPSFELRQQLLHTIASQLKSNDLIIFTAWQFINDPKLKSRVIDPTLADPSLTAQELEPNDYILDWQRGKTAYRYCHFLEESETLKLLDKANLRCLDSFYADGKNEKMNQYFIAIKQ